jgi:membrane dipeptidase
MRFPKAMQSLSIKSERRTFLMSSIAMGMGGILNAAEGPSRNRGEVVVSEKALALHNSCLLVDGHNDLPWQFRQKEDMSFLKLDLRKELPQLHTDIPRLKKGNVGAQLWAAYVPTEATKRKSAVRETLEQIDVIHRMAAAYPETFEFARTSSDIRAIRARGKIASLIGVEGGHSIDNSLGVLFMIWVFVT